MLLVKGKLIILLLLLLSVILVFFATPSAASYMKRYFWLHEFCVFDEVRQTANVYVWPESVASKGSQEIAYCIIRHLHTLPPKTKQLILYCDPLPGQNRNMSLSLALNYFLDSWPHLDLISIEQRFFVKGHGLNNCDRSFEEIKKGKTMEPIFLPSPAIENINHLKKTIWDILAFEMCVK